MAQFAPWSTCCAGEVKHGHSALSGGVCTACAAGQFKAGGCNYVSECTCCAPGSIGARVELVAEVATGRGEGMAQRQRALRESGVSALEREQPLAIGMARGMSGISRAW